MNPIIRTICTASLFLVGGICFGDTPAQNIRTSEFRATQLLRHKAAHDAFENEYMSPIREATKKRRALNPGKIVPSTDLDGPLLGDAEYEKKLWARLSADVVARRGLRNAKDEVRRVELLRNDFAMEGSDAKRLAGFEQCDEALWILIPKRDELEDADMRVGSMISGLEALYDARTIRLIAPVIFENDFYAVWHGDYGEGGFTHGIIGVLRSLSSFRVFPGLPPPDPNAKADLEVVAPIRKWWIENREKFGTVYELPNPMPPEPLIPQAAVTPKPLPTPTPTATISILTETKNDSRWWIWVICALALTILIRLLKQRTSEKD